MANEIQILHDDAAETVYCVVRNESGQLYDANDDEAFETFVAANWSDYAIGLTQVDAAASGNVAMQADMPAVDAGAYWLDVYVQAGAVPARTDYRAGCLLAYWNGQALTALESWSAGATRAALAVLAGNMTYDEATGETSFLDAEDGQTQRASYKVSATSVARTEASVS